ncbi:5-deoxy-glucuronate isomerase [Avibacterium paragallinarum]|uniref:5-deoxy-glucuronate isomerase n=2 Tax=Avibacterium paragallinarum TaxID=728 RepID=A0A0F5ETV6_AVIPA|nr:5-deoxy-glucuronate isomerase [Avibacterium paragallinarum]AZI13377.1 5-deoxy-glucuronate isomerase [Avibacterium paragallinarum]KAA6209982.1 5-deoxy-glucuronate isomerase [Avibacterium paragallinarum]KKB01198.1 5-deoxyglucuronate isomerase [Avibacterium paragallinarum]MEE3607781.1 5-deoxy-glucuronate isomerase [Avibacterium paragallinarum]MEE3620224.1 5-deoxy-glucuronate isomerase [Avibacterium paragallinarum]
MSYLLSKSAKQNPAPNGLVQKITPESAGWEYVGFECYHLQSNQSLYFDTEGTEVCFVVIAGKCTFSTNGQTFKHIGNRQSPFDRIPPYSLYVPHHHQVEIQAETYLELAVCRAPSEGNLPVRLITPQEVGVEQRGFGNNKRLVHNILPETEPADALLVVEVFTDEGNTSSYPSHKHDQKNSETETYLEETYYHRFELAQGFCLQRVYTDDRSLDECMAVYDGDVVKVPKGYHPVATIAGYNNYYLNVMAGPVRKWRFTWEKDHQWINSTDYQNKFTHLR